MPAQMEWNAWLPIDVQHLPAQPSSAYNSTSAQQFT
jgi:hypothetical protein